MTKRPSGRVGTVRLSVRPSVPRRPLSTLPPRTLSHPLRSADGEGPTLSTFVPLKHTDSKGNGVIKTR